MVRYTLSVVCVLCFFGSFGTTARPRDVSRKLVGSRSNKHRLKSMPVSGIDVQSNCSEPLSGWNFFPRECCQQSVLPGCESTPCTSPATGCYYHKEDEICECTCPNGVHKPFTEEHGCCNLYELGCHPTDDCIFTEDNEVYCSDSDTNREAPIRLFYDLSQANFKNKLECTSSGMLWSDSKCYLPLQQHIQLVMGLLAVKHFNERDSKYLDLYNTVKCDKKLHVMGKIVDTRSSAPGVKDLTQIFDSMDFGFAGAPTLKSATALSAMSTLFGTPLFTYGGTSTDLEDNELFPTIVRTGVPNQFQAHVVCNLLYYYGYENFAMFHEELQSNIDDKKLVQNIAQVCSAYGVNSQIIPFQVIQGKVDIKSKYRMETVAAEGLNIFLFVGSPTSATLGVFFEHAERIQILNPSSMWVFLDQTVMYSFKDFPAVVQDLLHGSLLIDSISDVEDELIKPILENWEDFDLDAFASLLPGGLNLNNSFFKSVDPATNREFRTWGARSYDTVVAVGMRICELFPEGPFPEPGIATWQLSQDYTQTYFQGLAGVLGSKRDRLPDYSCEVLYVSNIVTVGEAKWARRGLGVFDTKMDQFYFENKPIYNGGSPFYPPNYISCAEGVYYANETGHKCCFQCSLYCGSNEVCVIGTKEAQTIRYLSCRCDPIDEINIGIIHTFTDSTKMESTCVSPDVWNATRQSCILSDKYVAAARAILIAVEHFNARNPSIVSEFGELAGCNKRFRVVNMLNSLRSSSYTLSSLEQFLEERTDYLIGTDSDDLTALVSTVVGHLAPMVSYRSVLNRLSDQSKHPGFSRTTVASAAFAHAICAFWQNQNYKYATVLHDSTQYAEDFVGGIASACLRDFNLTLMQYALVGNTDFAQLFKTRVSIRQNVYLYVGVCEPHQNGTLIRAIKAAYLSGVLRPGMSWVFSVPSLLQCLNLVPDYIKRVLSGSVVMKSDTRSVHQRFERSWNESLQSSTPLFKRFSRLLELNKTNGVLVREGLETMGAFAYDAVAMAGLAACDLAPELPVAATDFLAKSLHHHPAFNGLSGNVTINSQGDRVDTSVDILLMNVHLENGELQLVYVGGFSKNSSNFSNMDALWYTGGTGERPGNVVSVYTLKNYSQTVKVTCYFLSTICYAAIIFCLGWICVNRKHPIVKVSQAPFLVIILFGTALSTSSIIAGTIDDEPPTLLSTANSACVYKRWLTSIGFQLTFSPLLAKIWRINKMMNVKYQLRASRGGAITNWYLFRIILAASLCDALILVLWTTTSKISFNRVVISEDEYGLPHESIGVCQAHLSYSLALDIYHFVFLLATAGICYKSRHIPTAFSESKYIGYAIGYILEVLCLIIPIMFLVPDRPQLRMFLDAVFIFVQVLPLLCLIFVPKILIQVGKLEDKEGNELLQGFRAHNRHTVTPAAMFVDSQAVPGMFATTSMSTRGRRSEIAAIAEHTPEQLFNEMDTIVSSDKLNH